MEFLSLFKEASMPDPDDQEAVDASFDNKCFAIYEEDLIQHPKYNDIGPIIESLKEKVIKLFIYSIYIQARPDCFGDVFNYDIGYGAGTAIGGTWYMLFFIDRKMRYKLI